MFVFNRFFIIIALAFLWPLSLQAAYLHVRYNHRGHQMPEEMLIIESGTQRWHFTVEVATTPKELEHGLMERQHLAKNRGMLFIFRPERKAQMWMKDTPLPLDMLFIDSSGRIVYIAPNTTPYSLTPISAGQDVRAVLELPAGTAEKRGIEAGNQVRDQYITP